jgi:hydrogenase maturation protein HypF
MSSPGPPDIVHNRQRLAITVRGVVQGVGFRPFVYNTARSLRLGGWVQNRTDTVKIEVEGEPGQLDAFVERVRYRHPPQAKIDHFESRPIPCDAGHAGTADEFHIRASNTEAVPQPVVPADMATCGECLDEIREPSARRHAYPFTNCTNCGPRWSIITQLPYDRPRTTMASFPMCDDCRQEYEQPADRRFHAQPIACPRCGPQLRLVDPRAAEMACAGEALRQAADALLAGKILAMKGIGGFQLLVDATNAQAVSRLRERKRRPTKPFAVMIDSLSEVRRCCDVSAKEAAALTSAEAPILLLWRSGSPHDDIAIEIAPGNPYLGVMLPCTPLHHLLMQRVQRPLVCTSGNLSEEPMAITTDDARRRLGGIADLILTHDRPIQRPVDDSVARVLAGGLQILRRARGYAPLPISLDFAGPTILAVGGHLKNTVGLSLGTRVVLSPHVGDLDHPLSVEVHRAAARDLVDFFRVTPEAVACDLHPDYASTRHAESLAAAWNVPLIKVQHHHAHVAACMTDNNIRGPVLGLSWDGTGYGPDGSVWGGEILVCEDANFTRVAHLRPFRLPGGDAAVREPRRSALGVLFELLDEPGTEQVLSERIPPGDDWFSPDQRRTLYSLMRSGTNAPLTTSLGRLFDAVAALCQVAHVSSYEGEAAMALEFVADEEEPNAYPLPLSDSVPAVADWGPLVKAVLADRAAGVPVQRVSGRFHNSLANLAVQVTRRFRYGRVMLTGGCFQNRILSRKITDRLVEEGVKVYIHRRVPPGDGGIALGQIYVASQKIKD